MRNFYNKKRNSVKSLKMALLSSLSVLTLNTNSMAMIGDFEAPFEKYYDYGRKQTGVVSILTSMKIDQEQENYNGTGFLLDTQDPNLKGRVIVTAAHVAKLKTENVIPKHKICFVDESYQEKWVESQSVYIHPSYISKKGFDDSKNPDLAFILLKDQIDTSIFKPLKMDLETRPEQIQNQEISVYGMSSTFGKANDCFVFNDPFDSPLRRGFQAIVNGPQEDFRQSYDFLNSPMEIIVSIIKGPLLAPPKEDYNFVKKHNFIENIKIQQTELEEKKKNFKNYLFEYHKSYLNEDVIDLIWKYLIERHDITVDLSLTEEERNKKLIDFEDHQKDILFRNKNFNEETLNIFINQFERDKIFLDSQIKGLSDLISVLNNEVAKYKYIFQDPNETASFPSGKQIPETEEPFVANPLRILSMNYDSSKHVIALQDLQKTYADLDIEKINQAIEDFAQNADLPNFIEIGNYLVNFNLSLELSGFTTPGDSGGAVVHQNEAIGIVTGGTKLEMKSNHSNDDLISIMLKSLKTLQQNNQNLPYDDLKIMNYKKIFHFYWDNIDQLKKSTDEADLQVVKFIEDFDKSDDEKVIEDGQSTGSSLDQNEGDSAKPNQLITKIFASDDNLILEMLIHIENFQINSDSEENLIGEKIVFAKDHEQYFKSIQSRLKKLTWAVDSYNKDKDDFEKSDREYDISIVKLIKDYLPLDGKPVLEEGQWTRSYFLPFSLQADWIQQTLQTISTKVDEEKMNLLETSLTHADLSSELSGTTSSESYLTPTDSDVEDSSIETSTASDEDSI